MTGILRVAIPVRLHQVFDYLPPPGILPESLKPGVRVELPFGRGRKTGVLLDVLEASSVDPDRLREAVRILDDEPLLSGEDINLLRWASHYYHHPLGEVIATAFPTLLRQGGAAPSRTIRCLLREPASCVDTEAALKRSPSQRDLFNRLGEAPAGLHAGDTGGFQGDFQSCARALVAKGLAVWKETVPRPDLERQGQLPPQEPLRLNTHQEAAVARVTEALGQFQGFLLDGVTGSGKTEVYLRLVQEILARGQQVMLLLPEINLTPQLANRFRARFPATPMVLFHSALTDAERCRSWLAMQSGEAAILLGTRSAVFNPMRSPGLIILDEEHDSSFKQHEGFRFSARDVAVMRAHLAGIPILLGSATPSLESLYNVGQGRYQRLELPVRAGHAAPPRFRILDIRAQPLQEGISTQLASHIRATLDSREQVLLFINRRGFAPTLICNDCGWVAPCQHCDAHLVIHAGERLLRCHHCGLTRQLPTRCPACSGTQLHPLGLGTERVEAALKCLFPTARVARLDRDSTRRKGSLQALMADVHAGHIDILVGTQMLAKGHHFPGITLVGIVDVDAGFFSTDYRAGERMAQLITQVAGRAGREERPGTVILQTRQPGHPWLNTLIGQGYRAFAEASLMERQAAMLPPCTYQALWRAECADSELAQALLQSVADSVSGNGEPDTAVLGPVPAPLARKGNHYRWQLLMQSGRRPALHAIIDHALSAMVAAKPARHVRWSVDVDPQDMY